jgi:hypothetical protein
MLMIGLEKVILKKLKQLLLKTLILILYTQINNFLEEVVGFGRSLISIHKRYIYMYIYTYMYTYICMCVYIYIYICIYLYMHTYIIHTCIIFIHKYTYIYMCIYMYVYIGFDLWPTTSDVTVSS